MEGGWDGSGESQALQGRNQILFYLYLPHSAYLVFFSYDLPLLIFFPRRGIALHMYLSHAHKTALFDLTFSLDLW